MKDNRTLYEKNVQDRNLLHYLIGLIVRWKQNFKYARARRIARKRGATIGEGVIMSLKLAKKQTVTCLSVIILLSKRISWICVPPLQ